MFGKKSTKLVLIGEQVVESGQQGTYICRDKNDHVQFVAFGFPEESICPDLTAENIKAVESALRNAGYQPIRCQKWGFGSLSVINNSNELERFRVNPIVDVK